MNVHVLRRQYLLDPDDGGLQVCLYGRSAPPASHLIAASLTSVSSWTLRVVISPGILCQLLQQCEVLGAQGASLSLSSLSMRVVSMASSRVTALAGIYENLDKRGNATGPQHRC